MKRTTSRLGLTVILAAPLAAQSPTMDDGCSLLTVQQVEAFMGEKLDRSPRASSHQLFAVKGIGCRYRGDKWRVEITLERGRSKDDVTGFFKALKGVVQQTTQNAAKPVPGVGDQAWWGPISATNGILTAAVGTDVLSAQTYGDAPGAGSLAKTQEVMMMLIASHAKLPKP
jgi:hypothetical protein